MKRDFRNCSINEVCNWPVCFVIGLLFCAVQHALAQDVKPFGLVNSVYDEQCPFISPDGNTLYFTVAKHPQNKGGKKDLGDIWLSRFVDGKWQTPVHGGSTINNENYNAVVGFNNDGSLMFLAGHYASTGDVNSQGISVASKSSTGWAAPKNISVPYFLNRSELFSAAMSADEKIMVFSAQSYATRGAEDVYVTSSEGGKWSEPKNLGSQINTPQQELSPWLSNDAKTLFFASNGWPGQGSFDIFKTERLDDTWTNWSAPINIGDSINSDARELFYRTVGGKILFTTTRDSDGYGDIHEVASWNKAAIDTIKKIAMPDVQVSSTSVLISGMVSSAKTGDGLSARIVFRSDSTYSVTALANGKYQIQLPKEKLYSIEVQKKGFVNAVEQVNLSAIKLNALQINFKMQPIEVGAIVNLKNVLFNTGTTTLLPESFPELDAVVDFLKENTNVEIQLEGHTDNRGDARKNMNLSQERVSAIKTYLVSRGIASRRVKGKGFGGTKPIATGDSDESRKLNRRVEFLILKS